MTGYSYQLVVVRNGRTGSNDTRMARLDGEPGPTKDMNRESGGESDCAHFGIALANVCEACGRSSYSRCCTYGLNGAKVFRCWNMEEHH